MKEGINRFLSSPSPSTYNPPSSFTNCRWNKRAFLGSSAAGCRETGQRGEWDRNSSGRQAKPCQLNTGAPKQHPICVCFLQCGDYIATPNAVNLIRRSTTESVHFTSIHLERLMGSRTVRGEEIK